MKNKLVILSLIAIVLISGCISPIEPKCEPDGDAFMMCYNRCNKVFYDCIDETGWVCCECEYLEGECYAQCEQETDYNCKYANGEKQ